MAASSSSLMMLNILATPSCPPTASEKNIGLPSRTAVAPGDGRTKRVRTGGTHRSCSCSLETQMREQRRGGGNFIYSSLPRQDGENESDSHPQFHSTPRYILDSPSWEKTSKLADGTIIGLVYGRFLPARISKRKLGIAVFPAVLQSHRT